MGTTPVPIPQPIPAGGQQPATPQGAVQAFLAFVKSRMGGAAPGAQVASAQPAQQPWQGGAPGIVGGAPPNMAGGGAPMATPVPAASASAAAPTSGGMLIPPSPIQTYDQYSATRPSIGNPGSLINEVAKTITSFKAHKDETEFLKAKNSLAMFQNAIAQGDMQVANLLGTDPKVVKSWEKYLKMEFPRLPGGGQSSQTPAGVNQPGGLAIPVNQAEIVAQKQAFDKRQADIAAQNANANQNNAQAGLQNEQAKAVAPMTLADIDAKHAQVRASDAATQFDQARTTAQTLENTNGDVHKTALAQQNMLNAEAAKYAADKRMLEFSISAGGTPAELNQIFSGDLRDLSALRTTAVDSLVKLQSAVKAQQKVTDAHPITSRIEGAVGMGPTDYTDEIKDAAGRVQALNDAVKYMNTNHDDVIKGKVKMTDVYNKAYDMAGLSGAVKPPLTAAEAKTYLDKAGGDQQKAEALAVKDGRSF